MINQLSTIKKNDRHAICKHNKRKTLCKECGGGSICEHNKRKTRCKECGGGSICEHNKHRDVCKECGGGSICKHNRQRSQCKDCLTVEQILSRNIICHGCCNNTLSHIRQRNGITVCAECDPILPQRTEKIVVPLLLNLINHPPSAQDNVVYGGNICDAAQRRPDILWMWFDRIVSLELDEHSHSDRPTSCELGKMHDQFISWQKLIGCDPVFYVRFNPDEFDGGRICMDDRINTVAQRINELLTMDVTSYSSLVPHVEFFYYHSSAQHHIDGVKNAPDSFILS